MSLARRKFLKSILFGIVPMGIIDLKAFERLTGDQKSTQRMPVLFIGHGSPMNAIEANFYTEEWKKISSQLPTPKAILCVSAHWLTKGSFVTMAERPKTIHDFYGFPHQLYQASYPAPGAKEFARLAMETAAEDLIKADYEWGLDHGSWSVLKQMFPHADIPTFQLSIDYQQPPIYHYQLANELRELRSKGILVIGSGNIVHNLRMMKMEDKAFDWAVEFDESIKQLVDKREHEKILRYQDLGEAARLSVPTPDHFYPLLYTLGMSYKDENIEHFAAKTTMASISMRSLKIGG